MKPLILVAAMTIAAPPVLAGEIEALGGWEAPCSYRFSGRVEPGDAAKIEALDTFGMPGASLCLDSPGGSLPEGIKIFDVIWNNKQMHTRVMNGDSCESACAIAWLGGSISVGTVISQVASRSIEPGAVLGFHAPSLDLPDEGIYPAKHVEEAFRIALKSAEGYFNIKLTTQDSAEALNDFLYARILETPGDSMFRVTTVAEAVMSNVLISGVKAQEQITKADMLHLCENAYLVHKGVTVGLPDAASHLRALREDAAQGERVSYVAQTYWAVRLFNEPRAQYVCLIRDDDFGGYVSEAQRYNGDLPYMNGQAEPPVIRLSLQRVHVWPDEPAENVWNAIADGSGEVLRDGEMPHYTLRDGMTRLGDLTRH
ncbi:hypothetical protein [Antarctobacter jejuensis]|uniref:hypothetical protein n=1 Tax=Antarctobacter jejuensis TaxID=1439938 RepID=UPI003FD2AED8